MDPVYSIIGVVLIIGSLYALKKLRRPLPMKENSRHYLKDYYRNKDIQQGPQFN